MFAALTGLRLWTLFEVMDPPCAVELRPGLPLLQSGSQSEELLQFFQVWHRVRAADSADDDRGYSVAVTQAVVQTKAANQPVQKPGSETIPGADRARHLHRTLGSENVPLTRVCFHSLAASLANHQPDTSIQSDLRLGSRFASEAAREWKHT